MKKFFNEFKDIDNSIIKIMKSGFKFSFILCIIFTYILFLYALNPISQTLFNIGFLGVKCSFMFFISFFICAIASNMIKKELS